MGFDRAFVHPVAMATGNEDGDTLVAGLPTVDIRGLIPLLKEVGYLPTGWLWVEDVPETFPGLKLDSQGRTYPGWKMDGKTWVRGCAVSIMALANRHMDGRMHGVEGTHFDVTASRLNQECYHRDHPVIQEVAGAGRMEQQSWRIVS